MSFFRSSHGAILIAVGAVFAIGCGAATDRSAHPPRAAKREKPLVYAVNYPLQYFAQRIGGERVEVVFPAPADVDPAYWQPDDQATSGFQEADLILLNGASYDAWTDRVSLPRLRVVNTSREFADQYIPIEDQMVHRHGPEGEHAHGGTAFTTWLDARLALQHAEAIHAAFAQRWPEHAADFAAGFESLRSDWQALDAELTALHANYEGEPLLASHPVYQYLARRCEWNLRSVHWEPDEMPEDQQWQQLQTTLETHPAPWMIWEAEPLPEIRERLAALGVHCAVFAPCGNVPESGDLLSVMRENLERLRPMLTAKR